MNRDIIAIGVSAGCLDTLRSIVVAFPPDFCGDLFVVVHIGHGRSRLPEVLGAAAHLPVRFADDCEPIVSGHIYVAPNDRHLLVEPQRLRLSRGPREHFTRPAIDPLFRSVAAAYGERAVGVVLSGGGSDGAAGLDLIKRAGGLAVVLDPKDAVVPEMHNAAAEIVHPDYIAARHELSALLLRLSQQTAPEAAARPSLSLQKAEMPEPPLTLTVPNAAARCARAAAAAPHNTVVKSAICSARANCCRLSATCSKRRSARPTAC